MASYNHVTLLGNITRDPEVRQIGSKQTSVCDISLAVNRKYKTESGEQREEVTFVDISIYGRTAEVVGEYCKKGSPLLVDGRLVQDKWTDKETGKERQKLKVVADNIQLLGGKRDEESPAQEPKKQEYKAPHKQPANDLPDDQIPY